MGAPRGDKTDLDRLPMVVWEVPSAVRTSFARLYVRHRAPARPGKATLQIREERPPTYFEDLQRLFGEATDETVTRNGEFVTISADAARALGVA